MPRTAHHAGRWVAATTVALIVSVMYATGYFYTHPAIILAAFVLALLAMFASVPLGLASRRNLWLVTYSGVLALVLTLAIPVVHFLWGGITDLGYFTTALLSVDYLKTSVPAVALMFAGILGTGLLAPVRSPS
jgi:hypothetical protein